MQKGIYVIKIILIFISIVSCSQELKTDTSTEFLKYYFSENFEKNDRINLIKNNSNEKIYETLYRYSENQLKQDNLIKEILNNNELHRIKEQIVQEGEWSSDIENNIKNISLSKDDKGILFVTKPILCQGNNFCLIYSYQKKNDIYFIPSIEVYKKGENKNWFKVGKISHF